MEGLECAVMIWTTVSDAVKARDLARGAVESRLAACVQQAQVKSVYRWNGAVEESEEVLLIMKTTAGRAGELIAWIRANHPYEVPEIITVPITGGLPSYLEWVKAETAGLR